MWVVLWLAQLHVHIDFHIHFGVQLVCHVGGVVRRSHCCVNEVDSFDCGVSEFCMTAGAFEVGMFLPGRLLGFVGKKLQVW